MHDTPPTLLNPTSDLPLPPATPSGLTPNTRSEAEAALTFNALTQTESAAPTTPLPAMSQTEPSPYDKALQEARKQSSVSSTLSTESTNEGAVPSETDNVVKLPGPLPKPGEGVVPLHTGVGAGQAEAVKRAKPTGMSLGALGRQPSWSEQDMKHIYSASLMAAPGDAGYGAGGYGSGTESKGLK